MATYTRADLKALTLSRLYREAGDGSIPSSLVVGALNRARRTEWRAAGGPEPETVRCDLVSGRREYTVPGPVAAVAVRDAAGQSPRRLERVSPYELLERFPAYPDNTDQTGTPAVFVLKPASGVDTSLSLLYRVLSGSTSPGTSAPAILLWPVPGATVADGLLVEAESDAAELPEDLSMSLLPNTVDEAATWAAALDLLPYVWEEENARRLEALLRRGLADARIAARKWFTDLYGGLRYLRPVGGLGESRRQSPVVWPPWSIGVAPPPIPEPAPVYAGKMASAATVNGSSDPVRVTTVPSVAGDTVMAFSTTQGFIDPAYITTGPGGTYVDVALPSGFTWAGETVYVFYETIA